MPSLSLLDEEGVCRVRLGMYSDGSPKIALFDTEGRNRGSFRMTIDGQPKLVLEHTPTTTKRVAAERPMGTIEAGGPVRQSRNATALFRQHCASCHDNDGSGADSRSALPQLPDFRSAKWQTSRSDAQLLASILNGRGTDMPPFRGDITEAQARELLAVIRGFGPDRRAASDVSGGGFNRRFQALEREFEELEHRFRSLGGAP